LNGVGILLYLPAVEFAAVIHNGESVIEYRVIGSVHRKQDAIIGKDLK
jgi:hypothetical protein